MLDLSFLLEGGSSFKKKEIFKTAETGGFNEGGGGVDRELAPAAGKGSCEFLSIL